MEQIICLSGWGQSHDSIENSLSDKLKQKYHIQSIDYLKFNCFENFANSLQNDESFKHLRQKPPIAIIGWSLGGQIALRLSSLKILNPQILFLIAPPFQFVKDHRINVAMSDKIFDEFYKNLQISPTATLKKFAILSIMNDKNRAEIIENFKSSDEDNLIYWLDELKKFSCFDLDFENIPTCKLFIGKGDMIVHPMQMDCFNERIKNCEINYFANCGHAPHLNDNDRFNNIIYNQLINFDQ
jgi:pimeloyl-ACP methyl ester carboxylesterase